MPEPKSIPCPACDATGVVPENVYKGHGDFDVEDFTCPLCRGLRAIPDRRAPTTSDRIVARVKDRCVNLADDFYEAYMAQEILGAIREEEAR